MGTFKTYDLWWACKSRGWPRGTF
ncbi:uncharacterized protein G2W53_029253 [Senna tora]|uniref:Uncharacterized protein n=1 Tax=Senna tora TaxID=362788 RepID=A0A834WFK2_9FABA|nr:uncharacterized protein G2W53_029253 [Senna tora]